MLIGRYGPKGLRPIAASNEVETAAFDVATATTKFEFMDEIRLVVAAVSCITIDGIS